MVEMSAIAAGISPGEGGASSTFLLTDYFFLEACTFVCGLCMVWTFAYLRKVLSCGLASSKAVFTKTGAFLIRAAIMEV